MAQLTGSAFADGIDVSGALSVDEALERADADWTVGLYPLSAKVPATGKGDSFYAVDVPNQYAVVREDKRIALGVVGRKYTPIQQRDALGWAQVLLDADEALLSYVVVVDHGRIVVLGMALKAMNIEVTKGDITYPYLSIINYNDGSGSCKVIPTGWRNKCANIVPTILGHHDRTLAVRVRHSGSIESKLALAQQTLSKTAGYFERFRDTAAALIETTLRPDQYEELIDRVFPLNPDPNVIQTKRGNNILALNQAVQEEILLLPQVAQTTLDSGAGINAWAVFNGFTRYIDHVKGEGKGFAFTVLQGGGDFKQRAIAELLDMAKIKVPA